MLINEVREEVAPFAGAWIEMMLNQQSMKGLLIVAPFAGAWIEINP